MSGGVPRGEPPPRDARDAHSAHPFSRSPLLSRQVVIDRPSSTIELVVKANDGDSAASAAYSDYLLESLRPHITVM